MFSKNKEETQKIAKEFAQKISKRSSQREETFVIGLMGDLGGGKTTFLQGFAEGLGIKEKILSPTFNIFKKYSCISQAYAEFYHFDCYRIKDSKEILDLGFEEIISNPKNIIAIEWGEKIKDVLPKNTFWIKFKFIDETTRAIDFLE